MSAQSIAACDESETPSATWQQHLQGTPPASAAPPLEAAPGLPLGDVPGQGCADVHRRLPGETRGRQVSQGRRGKRWSVQDVVEPGKVDAESLRLARIAYRAEVVQIMQRKRAEMAANGWQA